MIKTEVKEVSLYRNGCFVKRRGTLSLKKGRQSICIEGLPGSLNASTVRMSLPAGITGNNVQVNNLTKEEKEESLKELNEKIRRTDNKLAVKNKQIEMFNANSDFSAKDNITVTEMVNFINDLPGILDKIYEEIDKLTAEKNELQKQVNEIKKQNTCYKVTADIETEEDCSCPVELRYFDANAYWNPVYEIYASDEANNIRLKLKANMGQSTIENWQQVKVTLYTGNPQISGNIPELYPQYLNIQTEMPARRFMAKNMAMVSGAAANMYAEEAVADETDDVEYAMEAPMADALNGYAESRQEDTMMQYDLSGLWDIRNDNTTSADLTERLIDCEYHVVAVPKLDEVGYLAGEVSTADMSEVLNSTAVIYNKGTYLGEVFLNADVTKDKYDISLGRDETVKVKKEQKRKYTSNVLLKGQKKTEYEYEIKINSAKLRDCKITVKDQIPVTTDKSIVIEKGQLSSGVLDEKTGEIKWELEMKPAETKSLYLSYSVAWPKDKKINA